MNHRFWFFHIFLSVLFLWRGQTSWKFMRSIGCDLYKGIPKWDLEKITFGKGKSSVLSPVENERKNKKEIFYDKKSVLIVDDLSSFLPTAAAEAVWALFKWKIIEIDKLWVIITYTRSWFNDSGSVMINVGLQTTQSWNKILSFCELINLINVHN